MANPTYELLTKAQDLIRDPTHWTRGVYARTPDGNPTAALDPEATCWCSLGAISKILPSAEDDGLRFSLAELLSKQIPDDLVSDFNDTSSHAEVMEMWDKAREEAKRL